MGSLLLGIALFALAGCSADTYPLMSPGAESWHPTTVGTPVEGVVLLLQPRPGDQIELLSAGPVGVGQGADVSLLFAPPATGAAGSRTLGEKLEPLTGATFGAPADASPGPDLTVGVVARLDPRTVGTFTLTGVRLHFRVNGGSEQVKEGISERFTVCAGSPDTSCGPTPP